MTEELKVKKIKLRGMRRTIARRMSESLANSAQLTLHSSMEIPELVKFKNKNKLSYTDIFVKAVALTLKKHPRINASLIDNEIHEWENINIGLAIALEDGLLVPAIIDADQKTFEELAHNRKDIVERGPKGELTAEEVNSSTFTISNLGLYPIDGFTPIINPPQAAILGIGRIQTLPRFVESKIEAIPVIKFSLTIDHRIVDGEPGAKFLADLEKILHQPEKLI